MDLNEQWLAEASANLATVAAAGFLVLGIGAASYFVVRGVLVAAVARTANRTRTPWDDALLSRKVVHRVVNFVPVLVVYVLAPLALATYPTAADVVQRVALVTSVVLAAMLATAVLNATSDAYKTTESARDLSIHGPIQLAKLAAILVAGLMVVAILLDRSPLVLLSGLGALSAVLMLVFRDPILGFAAGLQLSSNRMLSPGDWIEVPEYKADGEVLEVGLTSVKVRNWDKTVTTLPTYALISESFRNWRGMEESGGRRIKRAINIDVNTVRNCSDEMLARFAGIELIADYVAVERHEVSDYNVVHGIDTSAAVNGRRLTNLGTFRAYVEAYLRHHPMIRQDMTLLVRQLEPTDRGLPLEVYAFCSDTAWARYEAVQADIFDHLIVAATEFDLRVFQQPSGHDFTALNNTMVPRGDDVTLDPSTAP